MHQAEVGAHRFGAAHRGSIVHHEKAVQGGLVFFPVQTALSTHPLPEPPARCDRSGWICSSKVAAHHAGPQLPQAFGHLPGQHKYTREAQPAHEHSQITKPTGQSKLR